MPAKTGEITQQAERASQLPLVSAERGLLRKRKTQGVTEILRPVGKWKWEYENLSGEIFSVATARQMSQN